MKKPLIYRQIAALMLLLPFVSFDAAAKDFDDYTIAHIDYPEWFKETFYDLDDDIAEAGEEGKKGVMILFTTQGCSYCARFIDVSLGDPELAARVQKDFVAIGMEIFDDKMMTTPDGESMPIKSFAKREGAEFAPTLLFLGTNGQQVLRLPGYQTPERFGIVLDYVSGGHYETASLREYYQSLVTAGKPDVTLIDDPMFASPPYRLAPDNGKPTMVLLEKSGCVDCNAFHKDVLTIDKVRESLAKFNVVRLDIEDTSTEINLPDGTTTTPATFYADSDLSRVPALMFYDESGKKALETDALVLESRMMNSINYTLDKAHEKDWTYQRYARTRSIERSLKEQGATTR
ncbi:MAG: thioredoxin fold domain-containing protein [Sedimenticolaceae bacterium]|nr:thioredoxin fold domain-containing protein [Sedimenticolaceae bacterium]